MPKRTNEFQELVALIRLTWALLDQKTIMEKNGKLGIELANKLAGDKLIIRTSELPRSRSISILKHTFENPPPVVKRKLVELALSEIGAQADKLTAKTKANTVQIFKIDDNKDGHWNLALISPKDIRLGIMGQF